MKPEKIKTVMKELKKMANRKAKFKEVWNYLVAEEPDGRKRRRWLNLHTKYENIIVEYGGKIEVM